MCIVEVHIVSPGVAPPVIEELFVSNDYRDTRFGCSLYFRRLRRRHPHVGRVLLVPQLEFGARKRPAVIDVDRELDIGARPDVVAQPCIALAAAGQDEHEGPVRRGRTPARTSSRRSRSAAASCRDACGPRFGRTARAAGPHRPVRQNSPPPTVVELDVDPAASLPDEPHVLDEQQVVAGRNPESTDLGLAQVTQEQELGPGGGAEPQHRRTPADRRRILSYCSSSWHLGHLSCSSRQPEQTPSRHCLQCRRQRWQ